MSLGKKDRERHTHTNGTFMLASAKDSRICREILKTQMTSSSGGGLSSERTLKANGAPPEAVRRLSEDHFRFIAADADRGPFEARKEDHLRQPA